MTKTLFLDGQSLTIEDVYQVAYSSPGEVEVRLAPEALPAITRAAQAVEQFVKEGQVVYGLTTGFGAFKDKIIPREDVRQLQKNILMSHAVGVGDPLDTPTVRAMILIRANTLSQGHSGVRVETLEALLQLLNRGLTPIVPSQGSLGASGDLAPLAHIGLVLIGEGEAQYQGKILPSQEALRRAGLNPITLEAKEGLALTNGTTMMTALGALIVKEAERISRVADIAGALSLEALHGTPRALDPRIHATRPHPRQMECAAYLRRLLEGSTFLRTNDPSYVQDAYTLRCLPQVHGAVREAIAYARWVIEIELNSATDNPLIFFDNQGRAEVISGGNFHGEPLAIAMDYLALALTDLGNISERRLTRLTDEASNQETLPAFLIKHGGLNSGFMLTQYTAAALAAENKVLAHPASADSIPSSANTEDHVSLGSIAARQARQILGNVEWILALELLAAAQGIDFRREVMPKARLGRGTRPVYELIRKEVPFLEHDAVMFPYIRAVHRLITSGRVVEVVTQEAKE